MFQILSIHSNYIFCKVFFLIFSEHIDKFVQEVVVVHASFNHASFFV